MQRALSVSSPNPPPQPNSTSFRYLSLTRRRTRSSSQTDIPEHQRTLISQMQTHQIAFGVHPLYKVDPDAHIVACTSITGSDRNLEGTSLQDISKHELLLK